MPLAIARADPLPPRSTAVARPPRALPLRNEPDARWVLAAAAMRALEGGRAAILPPESRARIVRLAGALGLRPFDAALVIAIVQDAASRGDSLGGGVAERLEMVPGASTGETPGAGALLAGSVVVAVVMTIMLAWAVLA